MGRALGAGLVALLLLTACSGGGGSAAKTTTTTSTTTSTTAPTTSTTSPEDAVKTAWLGYWVTIDRLIAAPDPDDPELAQRATDPVLSDVKADMATRKAQGRTTRPPVNSKYAHHIQNVTVSSTSSTVIDCYVDDRVQYSADGSVLNDNVSTARSTGVLVLIGTHWIVSQVRNEKLGDGDLGCAA